VGATPTKTAALNKHATFFTSFSVTTAILFCFFGKRFFVLDTAFLTAVELNGILYSLLVSYSLTLTFNWVAFLSLSVCILFSYSPFF